MNTHSHLLESPRRGMAWWLSLALGVPGVVNVLLITALLVMDMAGLRTSNESSAWLDPVYRSLVIWVFAGPFCGIVAAGVAAFASWKKLETSQRRVWMWLLVAVSLVGWLVTALNFGPQS